jgi:hypothetical protein
MPQLPEVVASAIGFASNPELNMTWEGVECVTRTAMALAEKDEDGEQGEGS